MRAITRSLVVGAAVLGLAGAGVGSASAMTWPKPKHHHHHVHNNIHKEWTNIHKEWKKVNISDDDRVISDSVIFVFGPQQSHVRGH
ncbi:hypothetical protein [Streptomyces axinellae]